MVASTLMTIEEFELLPDDGFRHELILGVLHRRPLRTARQGRIVATVGRLIGDVVARDLLGVVYSGCGSLLAPERNVLLGPDLSFVQASRLPIDEEDYPELAPDLVIEVVTPSDSGPAIEDKTELYLGAGVRLVLAIHPAKRTVRVRKADGTDRLLTERDQLDGEEVLPGFSLPVARLFV